MSTASIDVAREDLRWLHRFATVLARDADDAEDLVQDTLLQAWRSPPTRDVDTEEGSIRPWLATVLRNRFRMNRRGALRRERREQVGPSPRDAATPDTEHARLEVLRLLLGEIDGLPAVDQKIIVRRFLEDESAVEVGRALGMSAATIRTRTHRSMQRLRESLDRRYGERSTWCAAVLALPIPGTAATTTLSQGSSKMMSITLKIAAVAGAGTLGVAGWVATRPEPATPARTVESSKPEAVAGPAVVTPQAKWEARRTRIARVLEGEPPQTEAEAPAVVAEPTTYEELAQGCLEDLGAKKFGTITYVAREIGAPDIGTIYDSVKVAHSSFEDPEVRDCLVESMHAFVGPAPQEAFERSASKTMRIGEPKTREEQYEQIVSRIVTAHLGEVRYCGTIAGEGVTGSVRLEMDFDGGDRLRGAKPGESELPAEIVDCVQAAALRWKFPLSPDDHVLHHTFNIPVATVPPAEGD